MGIKGLPGLIMAIAGLSAIHSYDFSSFHKMYVAVDTSLIMYQTVIALRSKGKDLVNEKGELTSHLQGIFYKILSFLANGITPIFVFDGKAPDIKRKTLESRRERKLQAEASAKTHEADLDQDEYIKNFKKAFSPTKKDFMELQIMLDLMGIPYIIAPGEAEVVCAWLAARRDETGMRFVKGVCSDDSDVLALGAPYMFKDMLKFTKNNNKIKVISLHKAEVAMGLNHEQFVELCVLLGCDYCSEYSGYRTKNCI